MAKQPHPHPTRSAIYNPLQATAAARVYIVEDEPLIAENARLKLTKIGYEVLHISATGEEAAEKIPALAPDIVLMDIKLAGDLDGIETTERVLAHYPVPIIFTTAYSDEATLARVKSLSPYGYVLKPYQISALRTNIEIALNRFAEDHHVAQQAHHHASALTNYLKVEEAERLQLADSLHESIGQLLSAAKFQLEALTPSPAQAQALHQAKALLDEAIHQTRRLSQRMLPNLLRDFGLEATLSAYLAELQHQHPSIPLKLELTQLNRHLPSETAYGVYRLVQEAFVYLFGQPGVTKINVHVEDTGSALVLHLYAKCPAQAPAISSLKEASAYRTLSTRAHVLKAELALSQNLPEWLHLTFTVPV